MTRLGRPVRARTAPPSAKPRCSRRLLFSLFFYFSSGDGTLARADYGSGRQRDAVVSGRLSGEERLMASGLARWVHRRFPGSTRSRSAPTRQPAFGRPPSSRYAGEEVEAHEKQSIEMRPQWPIKLKSPTFVQSLEEQRDVVWLSYRRTHSRRFS